MIDSGVAMRRKQVKDIVFDENETQSSGAYRPKRGKRELSQVRSALCLYGVAGKGAARSPCVPVQTADHSLCSAQSNNDYRRRNGKR